MIAIIIIKEEIKMAIDEAYYVGIKRGMHRERYGVRGKYSFHQESDLKRAYLIKDKIVKELK